MNYEPQPNAVQHIGLLLKGLRLAPMFGASVYAGLEWNDRAR